MMTSKEAARYKRNDKSDKGKLLNEIESLSKSLNLDRSPSKNSAAAATSKIQLTDKPNSMSKHSSEGQSSKDKKSFWNWKPLKALSHIRHRRFNCCFTLHVHTIKGLPSKFDDTSFCVHWKRRDGEVVTSPIKVVAGVAEFENILTHTCSVYGSRSGPHHSAKYEAKHFLLYAEQHGNPKLDLGKHRVDLTRLLPLTLEELEDEKSSGTWTTTFKLSGEAKGAIMNVSFGYIVLGDGIASGAPNNKSVLQHLDSKASIRRHSSNKQGDEKVLMQRAGSLPVNLKSSAKSPLADDAKVLHEVPATRIIEFSNSVNMLYEKFDQENLDSLVEDKCEIAVSRNDGGKPVNSHSRSSQSDQFQDNIVNDENSEFSFIEKVVEEKSTIVKDGMKNVNDQHIISSDCPVDDTDVYVSGQHEADSKINEFVESSQFVSSDLVQENLVNDKNSELVINEEAVEFSEKSVLPKDGEKAADDQGIRGSDLSLAYSDAGAYRQEADFERNENVNHDLSSANENICSKESILEDLESVLSNVAELEKEALDSPNTISEENYQEYVDEDEQNLMLPSCSIDVHVENVADEFLSMLGIEDSSFTLGSEGEPESPRERLLREFEKEAEASGCSLFGFGIDEEFVEDDEIVEDDEYCGATISGWEEYDDSDYFETDNSEYPKIRAKVMEDLETQALMQEWGLDENAFVSSQPSSGGSFDCPIDQPFEEPTKLPPLGEGLGPFIQTKSGGFLRSMNPILFKDAQSGGRLIMQASRPVVVPAEMGSGVMGIVQHLASMGIEKLSIQANNLMPLEDITGRTMQQISWEAAPHLEASESQIQLQDNDCPIISSRKNEARVLSSRKTKNMALDDVDSEFASLEDLAPLAIDKLEALSIEGLKIQSGMSDEEAPSNISAQSMGALSDLAGKRVTSMGSMGLDGAAGLKLLALKDSEVADDDGLMGLSLTLDDWMRLDSGEINEDERLNERTSKLLAAHHAKCTDLSSFGKGERKQGKRCGLLGNNFTVALMIQLRDPLRDYEPVGTPMLALIEVERVFVPPKPKIYCRVSEAREDNNSDEDDFVLIAKKEKMPETKEEKIQEEDLIPQYKISEVHVSGFKTEPAKKRLWGSAPQQQSGSRWLLANGMGKGSKTPFMKPKSSAKANSLPATITSQPGDTLWSISARYNGSGAKWKDIAALNPHIRNPNVILSNETIRLR